MASRGSKFPVKDDGKSKTADIIKHYNTSDHITKRIMISTRGFTGELITHNFNKIANLLAPYRIYERVADIGCGFGYLTHFLPQHLEICEFDISSLPLRFSTLFRRNSLKVRSDACRLPLKENSFDKIFCLNLTPHSLDLEGMLDEINRVLRPGGFALVNFLNKFGLTNIHFTVFGIRFGVYFDQNIMTPSPQHSFSYKKMRELLLMADFEILQTLGWGVSFPHFLGQSFPMVAGRVTELVKQAQDSPSMIYLSNAIIFKVRKKRG